MALTFKGGYFLNEKKNTVDMNIENFQEVDKYKIPLRQHNGDVCVPIVKNGDRVLLGQKIADDNNLCAANIHSPVSGVVTDVVYSQSEGYIEIFNDHMSEISPDILPFGEKTQKTIDMLSLEDLISVVREAGICGMSGAGLPTWKKISYASDKVRKIIVNAIECEPYITCNHRLLVENFESVVGGLKILLFAFKIKNANIAVTDRDPVLVKKLKKELAGDEISLKILQPKYPQGDERQLIYSITGREVPHGKTGIDIGILTLNVQTVCEIYNAFVLGMPSIYRNLTVDGDMISSPKNLRVPIGTPTDLVLQYCGLKYDESRIKVIHGGPMMGNAVVSISEPITKTTTAVLAFQESDTQNDPDKSIFLNNTVCIRCAACVDVCPMRLIPSEFIRCAEKSNRISAKKQGLDYCVLCGLCEYVCPVGIPLMDHIRTLRESKDEGVEVQENE